MNPLPMFRPSGRAVAADRPEITWSIMHPTAPDSEYLRTVIAAADRYHVDSFEVCGEAHTPRGNIDGAIFFRGYPAVATQLDSSAIAQTIASLRALIELAHASGRRIYYWHREVMVPRAVVATVPGLLDDDGEFDLLGAAYHDLLRAKLREFFDHLPDMDGLVLTVTESDYSVIHNSRPDRYPPAVVIERLIRTFADELRRGGKRFILRSFGSIAQDYEDILAGAARVAPQLDFEIETKITPYDFSPFLDPNPFLRPTGGATLAAEYDSVGEFLGAGYLPAADPARVIAGVAHAARAGVQRHAIRVDRIGHPTFASTQGINLLAFDRAIHDPQVHAEVIWQEWSSQHWPACADEMTAVMQRGIEVVKRTHFIDGHLIFHAFPIDPTLKWIKAGGILSVFQPGIRLAHHDGMWGILSAKTTPARAAILREKDEAVALADACLAQLLALRDRLPAGEFTLAATTWRNATASTRLIRHWCRCVCAFFDDMEQRRPDHPTLSAAMAEAHADFARVAGVALPTAAHTAGTSGAASSNEYSHTNYSGDSIADAYARPIWDIILALPAEFVGEFRERVTWEAMPDLLDYLVCGGVTDDHRVRRYMHASHARLTDGRPARAAGNRVFPNGFIECRLARPAGETCRLVVTGDVAAAATFLLTVDGVPGTATLDASGRFTCPVPPASGDHNAVIVRIQKSGASYPWIFGLALVRADVTG